MPQTHDLLDLRGVSQRASAYRFEVLDNAERLIGEVNPARDDLTPVITHDTSRTIVRDMANLNLTPVDRASVNPLSDRLRPIMVLEDASEHPLGVFLFADASNPRYSYGETLSGTLVDKGLILDQAMDRTVGVQSDADVRGVVVDILDELGLASVVESATATVGAPMAWPGGTSRTQIITDLATNVGWHPPWFDHDGVCRVQRIVDPDAVEPEVVHEHSVYAATTVTTSDLLHAVNRTIAISSDSAAQAFVGVYDVPAGAPHSFHARGFRIVEVFNVQGIGSQSQIDEAARTLALSTGSHRKAETFVEHVSFAGPPDPRHDGYTVMEVFDLRWVEESWSLPLSPSGPMAHTLRRVLT